MSEARNEARYLGMTVRRRMHDIANHRCAAGYACRPVRRMIAAAMENAIAAWRCAVAADAGEIVAPGYTILDSATPILNGERRPLCSEWSDDSRAYVGGWSDADRVIARDHSAKLANIWRE